MSGVLCHMSHFLVCFSDKVVELEGLVSTGHTPSSLYYATLFLAPAESFVVGPKFLMSLKEIALFQIFFCKKLFFIHTFVGPKTPVHTVSESRKVV